MKTIMTKDGEIQVAMVSLDMMIEWTCSKCEYLNHIEGYMVPTIRDARCRRCGTNEKIDARLKSER